MTFCAVRCCAETQAVPGHEIHQNPLFFGTYSQSFQQFIVRPFCIHLEYINMVQIRASVGKGREQKSVFRFSGLILARQRADSTHSLSLSEAFEGMSKRS